MVKAPPNEGIRNTKHYALTASLLYKSPSLIKESTIELRDHENPDIIKNKKNKKKKKKKKNPYWRDLKMGF